MEHPDSQPDVDQIEVAIAALEGLMDCALPINFTLTRFIIISLLCLLALFGAVFNAILAYLFTTCCIVYEPNLALLAIMDSLLCFSYIAIFGGAEAVAHYLRVEFVYDGLYAYSVYGFTLAKVVQLAIPCMLLLSLLQRWCWITTRRNGAWRILHMPSGRGVLGAIVVLVAFLTRVPMLFSIEMHTYPNCTDHFRTKEIWPTELFAEPWYRIYDLCLTCIQVFVPFVLLILLNTAIVVRLRHRRQHGEKRVLELDMGRVRRRKYATAHLHDMVIKKVSVNFLAEVENLVQNENNAMMTMAIIVSSYLISNLFHVVLTIIENWASHLLFSDGGWTDHYMLASDTVNFLFMASSAIRLPIYYRYNPNLRRHLKPLVYAIHRPDRRASYKATLLRHKTDMNIFMASTYKLTGPNERKTGVVLAYAV